MRLIELRGEQLRSFTRLGLYPAAGWNVFVGGNGAGKTTILEAVYLLSHGRSFRPSARGALTRHGQPQHAVFGVVDDGERKHRLGLQQGRGQSQVRIDGGPATLGELVRHCAVVCFEPGSRSIIAGAPEERRRFVDWGVFHVEHTFLESWRRYQRALRQRNALLRQGPWDESALLPWETEMALSGEAVTRMRAAWLQELQQPLLDLLQLLLPQLGAARLEFQPGYETERGLAAALAVRRGRDRDVGSSTRGPHRADWSLIFEHAPRREHLSRGQEKLSALACLLAQAQVHARLRGHWPVLCMDDLQSELDAEHLALVMCELRNTPAQVWLTGTHRPDGVPPDSAVFHVEQGLNPRLL